MIEASQDLPFILESRKHFTGVLPGAYKLERDHFLILIIGPKGSIHFSHSTHPDLLDDLVGPDPASNPKVSGVREKPA